MSDLSEKKELFSLIMKGERELTVVYLEELARKNGYRTTMTDIIEPVLEDIGIRWNQEEISLAQGYIAGKVAEDFLLKVHAEDALKQHCPIKKGPVVLGNIEDDFHSLGRKLISIFLASAGWEVIDIGNDVPAALFVDKAEETGARVIGVSAMMYTTAENITSVRNEIDARGLSAKIKLAVGGAVFKLRPELVAEVGGNGTAANGFLVPQLMSDLWEASLQEVPL